MFTEQEIFKIITAAYSKVVLPLLAGKNIIQSQSIDLFDETVSKISKEFIKTNNSEGVEPFFMVASISFLISQLSPINIKEENYTESVDGKELAEFANEYLAFAVAHGIFYHNLSRMTGLSKELFKEFMQSKESIREYVRFMKNSKDIKSILVFMYKLFDRPSICY